MVRNMINNRLFLKRLFFLTKPLIFALVFCSLFMWESEISAVAVEPQITITPRSESAILGDAIVFDYSISGISEYENLYASFSIYKDEGLNNSQSSSNWNLYLSEVSGTIATINITDKDGQWYYKSSTKVRIIGYHPVEPQITITPRSESAILGDSVVFDYSISGISEYENLYASFSIYKDEGLNNSQSSSNWNLYLSEVSGTR